MAESTRMPMDSDVDLDIPEHRRELSRQPAALIVAVAIGGALGALARYGLEEAWTSPPGQFPWAVFVINVSGCFLMGILMVFITEIRQVKPLVRPFLGVGVLGGYTTFSTYSGDVHQLVADGHARTALVYLAATALTALAAVYAGIVVTRLAGRQARS
ncbi:fluoride efflux transporter CrcB [Actinoplanes solisilvae]|uniref:fluoride efflux transporter CrcB n=1 Tax=Actinoplanes solisilvae TaxID=2486853 RepID=UPI000FD76471|nr:fluoride efflux transporter CrcB [Actinoplanes solisilvae]